MLIVLAAWAGANVVGLVVFRGLVARRRNPAPEIRIARATPGINGRRGDGTAGPRGGDRDGIAAD